jgi:hypothetical protein
VSDQQERYRMLNRLCKWRRFFAGWQLGTRPPHDGEFQAVAHHRELSILLRCELSALTALLISKSVFTADEYGEAVYSEARLLNRSYEEAYPGHRSSDDGMIMQMPEALETMRRLGFPP